MTSPLSPEKKQAIADVYQYHPTATHKDVAFAFGVTQPTVSIICRERGVAVKIGNLKRKGPERRYSQDALMAMAVAYRSDPEITMAEVGKLFQTSATVVSAACKINRVKAKQANIKRGQRSCTKSKKERAES